MFGRRVAERRNAGRVAAGYARVVVWLRWLVVALWLAVSVAATASPAGVDATAGDLNDLVASSNPAVQAEVDAVRTFGYPVLSRLAVVQRNPRGLPMSVQLRAVQRAAALDRGEYHDVAPIIGAVPVANTRGLFPGSRERDTTVITLLYVSPDAGPAEEYSAARRFVQNHYQAGDDVVGVTGSVEARLEQGRLIERSLRLLEAVTVAAVLLIVAVAYRSLVAPLLTIAIAGVTIVITLHAVVGVGRLAGVAVPAETQPLLVALQLGVVTDYVVFYLSGMRAQLAAGAAPREAARHATARFTPIVVTAGLIVAAGTGALLVAQSPVFRAFGPGMAVAVLVAMAVAVTMTPALLAILGRFALWPHRPRFAEPAPVARSTLWSRLLVRRPSAALVLLACVGGLVFAALPVRHAALGLPLVSSLPPGDEIREAAVAAQTGFAPGILSPTELVVRSGELAGNRQAANRLQESLARQPGVAGVVGPADDLLPARAGLVVSRDGTAARYLLILSEDPLQAPAVATLTRLRADLPRLMQAAGLPNAQFSVGGDTAVVGYMVDRTVHDLARIAGVALAVNLLILVLFLRALVAPLCLLAASVLAVAASLGLTTRLFQNVLGGEGLTFYVPFVAAVLLVALGSDYNVFAVGRAWAEARHRPFREALATTLPESARTIRIAGITLAVSFGLLVLVPLHPFREIAFALSIGVLLDALVVRSLLVPAALALIGPASGWPSRRLASRRTVAPVPDLG